MRAGCPRQCELKPGPGSKGGRLCLRPRPQAALVPAWVGLLATPFVLYKLFPPEVKDTPEAPKARRLLLFVLAMAWLRSGPACFGVAGSWAACACVKPRQPQAAARMAWLRRTPLTAPLLPAAPRLPRRRRRSG